MGRRPPLQPHRGKDGNTQRRLGHGRAGLPFAFTWTARQQGVEARELLLHLLMDLLEVGSLALDEQPHLATRIRVGERCGDITEGEPGGLECANGMHHRYCVLSEEAHAASRPTTRTDHPPTFIQTERPGGAVRKPGNLADLKQGLGHFRAPPSTSRRRCRWWWMTVRTTPCERYARHDTNTGSGSTHKGPCCRRRHPSSALS